MSFFLEKLFNVTVHRRWGLGEKTFDPSGIRRILVVRTDNVGDVLCCTPAIRALRKAFSGSYLAAVVVKYSQDALAGNPDLDEIFMYERPRHRPDRSRMALLLEKLRLTQTLRNLGFDLAIGLRSSFSWSEAWLVYATGAPLRLGYAPEEGRPQKFGFFYNRRVTPVPDVHEVKRVLHLIQTLGVQPGEDHLAVSISREEKETAESFLRERAIDRQKLIGFHLSSRVPANRWGLQNFAELAIRLIREDGKFVVLTWGPGDEGQAQEVRERVGRGIFLFPTSTFKKLGAIQQCCRAFVSPDGGAMHFSTAVGTPTVGLFGTTNPHHWAPWGNGHAALRKGKQVDLISVDEVYHALKIRMKS